MTPKATRNRPRRDAVRAGIDDGSPRGPPPPSLLASPGARSKLRNHRGRKKGRRAQPLSEDRKNVADCGEEDHNEESSSADASSSTLSIYRRLLRTARIDHFNDHLERIRSPTVSEDMPSGRASDRIYGCVLNDRTFDEYGRPVVDEEKLDVRAVRRGQVHRDLLDVRAEVMERTSEKLEAAAEARMKREEEKERGRNVQVEEEKAGGDDDDEKHPPPDASKESKDGEDGTQVVRKTKKLTTPAWKIGTKPVRYGPPGLAPPIKGMSNSEGNEKFFNYDGEWKDGNMDGHGIYRFDSPDDGLASTSSTHEGIFRRNLPDGHGKAVYPGGTIYIGDWKGGYPHGNGRVTYNCGIVYDGGWKEGRRDGHGTLTYPNGSKYVGEFRRGKFHGKGKFKSGGSGLMYEGRFRRGYVSGKGTADYGGGRPRVTRDWPDGSETGLTLHDALAQLERERREEDEGKTGEREALLGPARMTVLEGYLKKVRRGMEERRRKEREDAVEEKRRTIRELRAKELERYDDDDSSGERKED